MNAKRRPSLAKHTQPQSYIQTLTCNAASVLRLFLAIALVATMVAIPRSSAQASSLDIGSASVTASDINVWQDQIDNPTTAANGSYTSLSHMLIDQANTQGSSIDGTPLTNHTDFAVRVVDPEDINGYNEVDPASTAEPSTTNLVDGATLQITHANPITYTDDEGINRTVGSFVTLNVSDHGSQVTDPANSMTYSIQSDDVRWLLSDVSSLIASANNYAMLRSNAGMLAFTRAGNGRTTIVNANDSNLVGVDVSALTAANLAPTSYNVIFTNKAAGNETYYAQSTSKVTLYNAGGASQMTGDFVWANNATVGYLAIRDAAAAGTLKNTLISATRVAAGNLATGDAQQNTATTNTTVRVQVGSQWIDVADAAALEAAGFNNWLSNSYQLQLQYLNSPAAEVTLQLTNPQISAGAHNFTTSVGTLDDVAAANHAAWLWNQSRATGSIDTTVLDATSPYVSVALDGTLLADAAWPTVAGTYTVTFTVDAAADAGSATGGADADTQGKEQSVSITMTVREHSSNDLATGPGTGGTGGTSGGAEPIPNANYVVFSNNFDIGMSELSTITDTELITRAQAQAFATNNLTDPLAGVEVTNRGELTSTLSAGSTVQIAFGYHDAAGSLVQAVSNATIEDDRAAVNISANNLQATQAELQQATAEGEQALRLLLFERAGVSGTDILGNALTAPRTMIYVDHDNNPATAALTLSQVVASGFAWDPGTYSVTFAVMAAEDMPNSSVTRSLVVSGGTAGTGTGTGAGTSAASDPAVPAQTGDSFQGLLVSLLVILTFATFVAVGARRRFMSGEEDL